MIRVIGWAAIFFAAMPYVGLAVLPSDVQPLALLVCALGMGIILRKVGIRLHLSWLSLPLWVMTLFATVSLVLRIAFDDIGPIWLLRSYYGYVSAPIILTFFLYYLRIARGDEIARVLDVALAVVFAGFLLNGLGLSWIIQTVVNRAVFVGLGTVRGLTSFFPEQSRISEQTAFFFFCYLLIGQVTKLRVATLVIASLLSAAGQVFVVLAQMALAYGMALSAVALARKGISLRGLTRLGLATVCVAWFLFFHEAVARDLVRVGFPARGITAVSNIVEGGPSYVGQDLGMMSKVVGLLHAAATLVENPLTFRLAAAADPGFRESIYDTYAWLTFALLDSTILLFPRRTSSALGTWIIEFGVLGLIAALVFVGLLVRRGMQAEPARKLPVLWAGLFLVQVLFVKIALANPSLWLVAALIWLTATPGGRQRAPAPRPSTA